MENLSSLPQQRKKLNLIFDAIISHPQLPEAEFDQAMQEWIISNEKLEVKEEQNAMIVKNKFCNVCYVQ